MTFSKTSISTLSMAICLPGLAAAEGDHHHDHGKANMVIVLGDDPVTIEFTSDLWNLVGFERAPEEPAEKAAVEEAQAALENNPDLISFNSQAGCARQSVSSNFDDLFGSHDDHDDHYDHDQHDHEEHDHDEHDHGKHDHEEGHHETLYEVQVSYTFSCARPDRITSVSVTHFDSFELLEEIEAVGFTANKQYWHEFRPGQTRMNLK